MDAVSVALLSGFDRAWLLPVPPFKRWMEVACAENAPHTLGVRRAVETLPAQMRSVLLMLKGYRPYREETAQATVSSFYVASNAAYRRAGEVLDRLRMHGVSAMRTDIPLKPLLAGFGLGVYGRNGLCAVDGFGSRFVLEAVLTDLSAETDLSQWEEEPAPDKCCADCTVCRASCPSHALDGTGRVDLSLCVRARAKDLTPAMDDRLKPFVGASVWGCDLCQNACPRNADVLPEDMPEDVRQALDLKRLLTGDVEPLADLIGTNFARKGKMRARAAMVAANTGRKDLVSDILPLLENPEQGVRDCARWAIKQLEKLPE